MLRPCLACNLKNTVHMIRHDHKAMQIDPRKMQWNPNPTFVRFLPERRKLHLASYDPAKDALFVVCTNRDEVEPGRGIITAFQPDRSMPRMKNFLPVHVLHLGGRGAACCAPTNLTSKAHTHEWFCHKKLPYTFTHANGFVIQT